MHPNHRMDYMARNNPQLSRYHLTGIRIAGRTFQFGSNHYIQDSRIPETSPPLSVIAAGQNSLSTTSWSIMVVSLF